MSDKTPFRAARTTVLHLCPDLEPGDPAREAVDLAVLTQRAGWRSLIASGGGSLVTDVERAAVRHTKIPLASSGALAGWRSALKLASLVQKERPVLIHAYELETTRHAIGVAKVPRLPIIADLTKPLPDRPRTRRILRQLEQMPSAIRVPSEFMAAHLTSIFQWPESRLQVISPGIDAQWYHAGSIGPERLRTLSRLWRLPEQSVVIVMPMPFTPGGGHLKFLEALALLKREDLFAVFVGDNRPSPTYRAQIEAEITRLSLNGKVIMPDYCPDWSAACWLANIIVAANDTPRGQIWELLVAQAIGRPVVITDCGANREMIEGGEGTWIIPTHNRDALANAINEAARLGTQGRVDLAERTRSFVTECFPQARWFNSMMDLYDAVRLAPAHRLKAEAA